MANATDIVKKGAVRRVDEFIERGVETLSAETRFWPNALIGCDTTGYLCKGDDTQSWTLFGIVTQDQGAPLLPISTAGDGTAKLRVQQPLRLELQVASVAVTDIGKKVYALDDQTGTLDASATTYANFVGHVVDVAGTNVALVELSYGGVSDHLKYGVAKWLAATGTQTLTKLDLNKTIFCPNTAAHTVNLPAVASTQAGDRLIFVKTTSDAQAVTLDGNASETIDGSTTLATIDAQYDCVTIVSTGTAWIVLNRDLA